MEQPDVIVVGAGAGGPVVAKELAERGIRVLMLEAGPWLDPDRDFSRLEHDMSSIVDGRLRWGPADRSRGPWMRRRDGAGLVLQSAGAPLERKAKRATNVSYVPAAMASGNCEIVPNAFANAVLFEDGPGERARARGVRWRDTFTGDEREAEASIVVLAGGSIENPRLWLNSGLPNAGGAVGRFLTTHAQDLVTGFFDHEVHPDVGQVTMARADFPGFGTVFTQGFGPQSFAVAVAAGGGGTWDEPTGDAPWDFAGRFWGPEAVRAIDDY